MATVCLALLVLSLFGGAKTRLAHDMFKGSYIGCCIGIFFGWLSIKAHAAAKANLQIETLETDSR